VNSACLSNEMSMSSRLTAASKRDPVTNHGSLSPNAAWNVSKSRIPPSRKIGPTSCQIDRRGQTRPETGTQPRRDCLSLEIAGSLYLYVILDIFSRRVVGWCVADAESATLFQPLFDDAIEKHNVPPGQLTLHADRGGPMKAKATAFLLADLGVTRSHNRPHTSNDNPFSESHFKTLKYQPRFPKRFGCIEDARAFCRAFFDWYNQDHHHCGIGLMTPDQVHYGQIDAVHAARQRTLNQAFGANPERFVKKPPVPPNKPTATWINPPTPRKPA